MYQNRPVSRVIEALKWVETLIKRNYSIDSQELQTAIDQLINILRGREKDILTTNKLELRKITPLTREDITAMRQSNLRQEVRKAEIPGFSRVEKAILTGFEQMHPAEKAALEAQQARDQYKESSHSDAKAAALPPLGLSADKESQDFLEKKRDDKSPVVIIEDEEVDSRPPKEILAFSENGLTFKQPPCMGSFWTPPRKKAAVIVLGGIAATAFANELILTACDLAAGADVWQRFADSAAYGEDFFATYGKTIPDFMKNSPTGIPNFSYFLIGAALLAIAIVTYKLHDNKLQAKKMVEEAEEAQHSLYGSGCYYISEA